MKHTLQALLIGAAVLTLAACNSGSKGSSVSTTPICISATDLSAEIAHNWRRVPGQKASQATDLRYKGNTLVITGKVYGGVRANPREVDLKGDSIYLEQKNVQTSGQTSLTLLCRQRSLETPSRSLELQTLKTGRFSTGILNMHSKRKIY